MKNRKNWCSYLRNQWNRHRQGENDEPQVPKHTGERCQQPGPSNLSPMSTHVPCTYQLGRLSPYAVHSPSDDICSYGVKNLNSLSYVQYFVEDHLHHGSSTTRCLAADTHQLLILTVFNLNHHQHHTPNFCHPLQRITSCQDFNNHI
ncbi:unnamed protein product [Dibothriocephalus latus]|uniref:Uncharacterized protein n=1 Tax=Dibothriocephalus latus TaxID=60516 RepID=A0A3P7M5E3_DIBLA|nr:unnamed protein product [Dibothriocephalus latus]